MENIFRFKQFEVDQSNCAMKINTDGVLLGAMTKHENPKRILDIGTGTGVIALMLAQRFPTAQVHAVEIDEQASATAARNFENSVFSKRLTNNNISIEQYNNPEKFDLIVTNPPFFVNDYKNAEPKKEMARHASHTFFAELIKKVGELLSENACFWFVLPIKQAEEVVGRGEELGLFTQKVIKLHSDVSKPEFRRIVCLGREKIEVVEEDFMIYESEKKYTKAYELLLKDFFLAY
ncbi:MAG: methyltransferase [Pedobacter sp.]|uniref:tRNA1(Val) (adenine(37)-N6)-methyltransferase n=1 Tax=Pedobacter sp. TaxID=1411316 RepID=UPI0028096F2C|nr:methyltransferase [Pedobacter sp.]MDQ8003190.1 methyltransferase [Pedobacter sp.]